MGDRANVFIPMIGADFKTPSGVYLYDHWGGATLPYHVQSALARRQRWDHDCYLARMIYCEMIRNQDFDDECGPAICSHRPDNEHPVIVVNCNTQKVGFAMEGQEPRCYIEWTFDEYVALDAAQLRKDWEKD